MFYMTTRAKPFITAIVALLLLCGTGMGQSRGGQRRPSGRTANQSVVDPQRDLLERADFFYRTDDTSDAADQLYKQILDRYPTSPEAGYAQYNRGAYWQRKYYILKAKTGAENLRTLSEAEVQFYNFLQKFGNSSNYTGLAADAHFYLALVYLQQGKRDYAIGWLNLMKGDVAKRDPQVYVYKVVWSTNPTDLLDRNVSSRYLAEEMKRLIQKGADFDKVVSGVKSWCRKQ